MKRRERLRILEASGCVLRREGARHSIFLNAATGKTSAVPRHIEIKQGSPIRFDAISGCRNAKQPGGQSAVYGHSEVVKSY